MFPISRIPESVPVDPVEKRMSLDAFDSTYCRTSETAFRIRSEERIKYLLHIFWNVRRDLRRPDGLNDVIYGLTWLDFISREPVKREKPKQEFARQNPNTPIVRFSSVRHFAKHLGRNCIRHSSENNPGFDQTFLYTRSKITNCHVTTHVKKTVTSFYVSVNIA